MNKFNLGLHSALFLADRSESLGRIEPVEFKIQNEVILPTQAELKPLKSSLNQLDKKIQDAMADFDEKYYNFSNKVGMEIQQLRANRNALTKEQLNKIRERHNGNNLKWNENVRAGYEDLITALTRKGYFVQEKSKKVEDIQKMYIEEATKQYEQYVWDSPDDAFNAAKERLFTRSMGEAYPANKIYTKLTGAVSIFSGEREYTEGYGVDVLGDTQDSIEGGEAVETMSDRSNRLFLSRDLPKYLWDIRTNVKLLENYNLGIISKSTDRPSRKDRDAISDFVKASHKIEVAGGKDPALALLEALHDNRINTDTTKDMYKLILSDHGITLKSDRYLDDIVRVGNFYILTQMAGDSERDQHGIYLSVLKIIENEGGVVKAVNKLKPIVDEANKEKAEEMESGEKLQGENQDLYDLAKKLGITNFTNATRLAYLAKSNPNYFKNTPVEKIIANLNNDRSIDARDVNARGLKSGSQFLNIFNQIGKETALPKLLEHAKLLNKSLSLGLDESKITEEEIKGGNAEVILLLQDIISNPGEDLLTLLSGKEGEKKDPFEGKDLSQIEKEGQAREEAFKKAGEILTEKAFLEDYKELLKGQNVDIQNFADLQASLASCLYDNYKIGLGVGSTLSFDDWAKGLQIGTGAQVREDGVVLGLSISYSKTFDVGNGWSLTPGLSAGVFLPIVSGDANTFASAGLNLTADKKKINLETGTAHHYGFDAGFNVLTDTAYLGRHHNRNKLEGLEESATFQGQKFEQMIMWDVLDRIKEKLGDEKMDLDNPEVASKVREVVMDKVKEQKDIKEGDRENVVNGMIRRLTNYKNADLNQPGVKYAIAKGIADEYKKTWSEARKDEISKNAYLSGYSIGAFWVVGTPEWGVYATMQVTKHDADGYADKWGETYELISEDAGEWNEATLNRFNQQLGLPDNNKLRLENGFVVIPASLIHRVNVNDKMKGLMKKNANGDVLIDIHTPMAGYVKKGASIQGSEIMIGGKKGEDWEKLDMVSLTWFSDNIDQNAVLELGEAITTYNVDILNHAIEDLKKKFPAGDPIQNFDFTKRPTDILIDKLNALDKTKVAKLTLSKRDGMIVVEDPVEGEEGRGLEMEYQATFDMMDKNASDIAEAVYKKALELKNPGILNAVKHDRNGQKHWPEYDPFRDAIQSKDYVAARDAIKVIFAKLDKQIGGNGFTTIGNKLDDITDVNVLGQALMSINNVFARSVKVIGGGSEYRFTTNMGNIIAEREGQISKTIQNYNGENITPEVKAGYQSLIEASGKYRQQNKQLFNRMSSKAHESKNTVGFNLGDKTNPENPLFNPEIYDQTVDLNALSEYGFDENARNALQERTMRLFAGNEALINPILKYLGREGEKVTIKEFKADGEKGKLILDIGGKKVTLSAGMEFGYFTQCVNHTVILNNIELETEDGSSVTFNSDVWEDGVYREGSKSTIVSTRVVRGGLSVGLGGKKEDQPEGDGSTKPGEDEEDIPGGGSSTPGADDGGSTGTGSGSGTTPPTGGEGNGGSQGGGRGGTEGSDGTSTPGSGGQDSGGNTPPTGGEGQSGSQGGGMDR